MTTRLPSAWTSYWEALESATKMRPTLERWSENCEATIPLTGPAPSWWPLIPLASAEERSTTRRSGSLRRNTVKVGARLPETITWVPPPVGRTLSSLKVLSSAAEAVAPPTSANPTVASTRIL